MTDAGIDKSSRPAATIEISLGKLQQLLNSLDPSPFHDRDLDHDAEEYIVGSAEEIALQLPLKLIIHLPKDQLGSVDQPALERAIHNYFAYLQQQSRRRLRLIFHDGRIALVVGIAFLFVCILIRHHLADGSSAARHTQVAAGLNRIEVDNHFRSICHGNE